MISGILTNMGIKTVHKSLTIAFLAVCIFISGLSADMVRAQSSAPEPMVTLTPEERAWLIENPHIRLATLTNQPPFSMKDATHNHTGVLADILALLSDAIGQRIETELVSEIVSGTHKVAKEKGIYGSASIVKTPRHGKEYLLTDTYMETPFYIFTRAEDRNKFRRPIDLKGKRVSTPRNHRGSERFLEKIGGVQRVLADTPLEQMRQVVSGEADALIGYFTYPYLVNKYLMVDLVMAFIAKSDQAICIGVNPEHPVLHGILNKAIATLDDSTINAIAGKWTKIPRDETPTVQLTEEEKKWLREHPVITLGGGIFPPMDFVDGNGRIMGLGPSYTDIVAKKLGIKFKYISGNWAEIQQMAREKKIDGIRLLIKVGDRKEYLNFSHDYAPYIYSILIRTGDERITSLSQLAGKTAAVHRKAASHLYLEEHHPDILLHPKDSNEAAVNALVNEEVDALVSGFSTVDHIIRKRFITGITTSAFIKELEKPLHIGVRKDWPEFIPIINKALDAITAEEHRAIQNRWLKVEDEKRRVLLTAEERAWLDTNPVVRVGLQANMLPVSILDEAGEAQGISIDYLSVVSEYSGIKFKFIPMSFEEVIAAVRNKEVDLFTGFETAERKQFLEFTTALFPIQYVILMRQDAPFISGIAGLSGKKVSVVENIALHEYLRRDEPEIEIVPVASLAEGLKAASEGKVDAHIGDVLTVAYTINREKIFNLKIASPAGYPDDNMRFGVRRDWPELVSILNKAIASIPPETHNIFANKWMAMRYEAGFDYDLLWKISLGFLLVLTGVLAWNQVIRRQKIALAMSETRLRKARDEAEAANRAKSTFLANMSHELRTPLNAILGFSGMLARERDTTADQQEKLAIINRSGQHLLSMINDVLDLSKIEAGRAELQEDTFDLVALTEEISVMIQSRAVEKGLFVVVEAETASFPSVKADGGKLRQILINLLGNAVKFTDKGGVTIRCDTVPIPGEPTRCHIVIEVEDTGPGIDPARQAKIYDPFMQGIDERVRKGTGLGLSICKAYADLMGGTLEVESELGKGSLFRVRLPAKIAEAADDKTPVDDKPKVIGLAPAEKTWQILVADDNRENLLLLKSLLEVVGFVVLEAKNGQEAVAAFKKESPDLIWMDIRMPVMDGYEAARQIRQCSGGDTIPIIAITASAFREQRHEILAAGCDDMVIKPFRPHEIFEVMGRFLDIGYIYEAEGEATPVRVPEIELTAAMLADLPAELLQELREATKSLNSEAITAVIERIEPLDPDTAKGLQTLMDDFQIGRIHDLLGEVER